MMKTDLEPTDSKTGAGPVVEVKITDRRTLIQTEIPIIIHPISLEAIFRLEGVGVVPYPLGCLTVV